MFWIIIYPLQAVFLVNRDPRLQNYTSLFFEFLFEMNAVTVPKTHKNTIRKIYDDLLYDSHYV